MEYNVYYKADFRHSILNLDEESLHVVISAYKEGKENFTIGGEKFHWRRLSLLKIFTNSKKINNDALISLAKQYDSWHINLGGTGYISEKFLSQLGEDVTKKYIGNTSFGEVQNTPKQAVIDAYINKERIEEIRNLSSKFDLSKLVRLCEELNSNYEDGNYYSVAMLGRAIIDHIPPIFNLNNFNEVSNNYGSKSIRGNLKHLNESMRNISDGILHSHIRAKESLPNSNQVKFSQDLDVLLSEIINVLASKK